MNEHAFSDDDEKSAAPEFLPAGAGRVRVGETLHDREQRLYREKLDKMTPEELDEEDRLRTTASGGSAAALALLQE
jgi:hypothetical protein